MREKKTGTKRIIIAGGGASGMCAAVLTARAGFSVTVLEKGTETGKKLSMTGNGRCNLSNLALDAACYNETARPFIAPLLARWGVEDTVSFFRSVGILVRSEEGYLYPVCGEAKSVVKALEQAASEAGATIRIKQQVKRVMKQKTGAPFLVQTNTDTFEADAVILAGGGMSGPKACNATGDFYYIAEQLGLRTTRPLPALVRMRSDDPTLPSKAGVRAFCRVRFLAGRKLLAEETGEVQLTAEGISGIPVLQASAACAEALEAGRSVMAVLDLFPQVPVEDTEQAIRERLARRGAVSVEAFLNGYGNRLLNEMICTRYRVNPQEKTGNIDPELLTDMLRTYRNLEIPVRAVDGFRQAQATRGGVCLTDLTAYLEAKSLPGLFVTGELCDVDGRCGGYNLQWAWSSAMAAAEGAGKRFGTTP